VIDRPTAADSVGRLGTSVVRGASEPRRSEDWGQRAEPRTPLPGVTRCTSARRDHARNDRGLAGCDRSGLCADAASAGATTPSGSVNGLLLAMLRDAVKKQMPPAVGLIHT
jgi:hypothetical protein